MPSNIKTRHLDNFQTIKYDISGEGDYVNLKNITQAIELVKGDPKELAHYTFYRVLEGERPDIVSNRIYGTPEYYWIFFILNDNLKTGLNGWHLTDLQMEEYLTDEYDPYFWLSGTSGDHPENSIYSRYSQELFEIPLDEKYLPHLRITYENKFGTPYNFKPYDITSLKIERYDHNRLGLVVHQPSELQHIKINIEGPGNESQPLTDIELQLSGGSGGLDKNGYVGTQIIQASATQYNFPDQLGNFNNLIFTAGEKYVGKVGNDIIVKTIKINDENVRFNYIQKPIISETPDQKILITFKYTNGISIRDFEIFVNSLDYDNNVLYEKSPLKFSSSNYDYPIGRLAITHDSTYLGWEWQRKCYDLGLHGWNMQAGPWVPPIPIEIDPSCAPIYPEFEDNESQRAAVFFNTHHLFSHDTLRKASHEFYGEYRWSPSIPIPGLYEELSDNEKNIIDNVIAQKEILTAYDVITQETKEPTGILPDRITYEDHEFEENFTRRILRVPRQEVVVEIANRYQALLNLNN